MPRYEWLTSIKTSKCLAEVAPPSISVITVAQAGEPYSHGDYTGKVPEDHVWLALVGPQEGIDQLWRDYYAED